MSTPSNFDFLNQHDELLVRLAQTAEACFAADPNTTLIKMRQLGEALAQSTAARVGVEVDAGSKQIDLLRKLDDSLRLDQQIREAFHQVRKLGNSATHDISSCSHSDALKALRLGFALSGWYHKIYGGDKAKGFKLGAFIKPEDPSEHADEVVEAPKNAIENYHGEAEDDAVQKITGASDKPLTKIRHYKNDRLPNVAVTVDLLTTGVDVPTICNLVFLRRVNSRILFEQMLGRATRLCPEIGKGPFRIYDAVDIYKQLEKVNTMKPVVTKRARR